MEANKQGEVNEINFHKQEKGQRIRDRMIFRQQASKKICRGKVLAHENDQVTVQASLQACREHLRGNRP